ncbi:hypothetical protein DCAR_0414752 [Daucus carota subsp. sativus]|uniref:GRF-type domain-containing protein n=1 Tax=Daucus carota subsp. sativus TaxID=79200 RepID=A0A162A7R8_DAUCS|nr:hypothetical protein DCAR_0414752 [Daucus carota subsp. sativus]
MSTSSVESTKSLEQKCCWCGKRAWVNTSWTHNNPGRRFYTCGTMKNIKDVGDRCNFFEWFDQDFSRRAFDVITHLNHRRIYLEEKLKLLEENLAENGEKKKTLKEDVRGLILENNRLKTQLKFCVVLCVVMLAVVLML